MFLRAQNVMSIHFENSSQSSELLPDDTALDRHLRLLFWEGLKPSIKDKARHKKDECKTFGDCISAAQ